MFWRIWYADLVTGPSRMNAFCVEKHGNCLIFAPGNASVGRSFSVYIWLWLICPKQNGRDSGCVHAEDMICGLVERLWWGFLPPSLRRDYRSVCLFSIYLIDPWLFLHVLCLQFKSHFALKLAGTTPYRQLLISHETGSSTCARVGFWSVQKTRQFHYLIWWSKPVEIYPCLIKSCSGANNPEDFNDENLVEIHVQVQREHF